MHFLEKIKQQLFSKAVKYKAMYGIFSKSKLYYLRKMHGYPQFSFWIPRTLAIKVLLSPNSFKLRKNIPVLVGTTHRKPKYLEMRRICICRVTKVGTVLNKVNQGLQTKNKKSTFLNRYIPNSHNDQLPVGLMAQLVVLCTGICRGHGFKSCSSLNFFQAFFSQLLKLCI